MSTPITGLDAIIKEVDEYYRTKLFAKNLRDNIVKVLRVINDADPKTISKWEKQKLLRNTWDILKQNRTYGFNFDYAPSQIAPHPALHYLQRDQQKTINATILHAAKNHHHLLIGENYYALQNLLVAGWQNKIDIIYIDPPYNTKEMQSYADKFGRDGWLSMMKERLELAHKLLSEDGVIFVSIDDNEQAYLKVLMDEIFGEDNFVTTIIWVSNLKGRQVSSLNFSKTYEYILVFQKNINVTSTFSKVSWERLGKILKKIYSQQNYEIFFDQYGEYTLKNELKQTNISKYGADQRPNLRYPIYILKNNNKTLITTKAIKTKGVFKIWPLPINARWRWSEEKVNKEAFNLFFDVKKQKIFTKNRNFKKTKFKNVILSSSIHTKTATDELKSLKINFHYPKPSNLIKLLISICSNKNAIVLDFFAGTGTTGHAVMDLNREDGGRRKFILVTNKEQSIDKICYERLYRIITGHGTKNETDFPWIKQNQPYQNDTVHYYSLQEQNITLNETTPNQNKINQIIDHVNEAYHLLNKSLAPQDKARKEIIKPDNWFDRFLPLLTNANINLQDKQ